MKRSIAPLVNLNVNPCKMCMPMGVATAFYGIQHAVTILHGSQGCSTYIRRHMATHYNEPVDIASSSLTEHGTVYGGEENLKKGLCNLIELYHPRVIGVATSCLAETIGEDIKRIIGNFREEHKEYDNVTIIPVPSPGYGGTQAEGFQKALYSIVANVEMNATKHDKVNVVTSYLSPEDTRYLKSLFASYGIELILLPDLSDNLDGGMKETYDRLPQHGTPLEDIQRMAGAKMTIELMEQEDVTSVGSYLLEEFGVQCKRMKLPVGLRATDALLELLKELSGKEKQKETNPLRGRYLDAMIDSHKYNSAGRAVVFGEPEFIISTIRLCEENGIMPVVVATGSVCPNLKSMVEETMKGIGKRYLVEDYTIIDDADFKDIEQAASQFHANVLIGNSDGRRMEETLDIPLVRRGFPIHDRIGGQRLRMLGYEGSLQFLDEITNALLMKTETGFREELYDTYYKNTPIDSVKISEEVQSMNEDKKKLMEEKTKSHPCFNCGACNNARIHLPVAPKCNIQCNYCVRKFDCMNESRPGVTTKVLTPEESIARYKEVKAQYPNLTVVGIAGPGDALANFEEVKTTLAAIREYDPEVTFCVSTNGLMLPNYVEELVALGISHMTVTVNCVDPKIGAKIYKYINYMGTRYEGEAAAAILLTNQLCGLKLLVEKGVVCKVNIVGIKGINDHHIETVVKKMHEIGCFITNIMPMIPVEGSGFEGIEVLSNKELNEIRITCSHTMKQMFHCQQCRADAVGTLTDDQSIKFAGGCSSKKTVSLQSEESKQSEQVLRFAIASKSGLLIDEHFGHVSEFHIYEYKKQQPCFLEKRAIEKYCTGEDHCEEAHSKMDLIMETIKDCDGVIAMRMGEAPKKTLRERGVYVVTTYDRIEEAVKKAADSFLHSYSK